MQLHYSKICTVLVLDEKDIKINMEFSSLVDGSVVG